MSLILQATGGALAAKAHKAKDESGLDRGTDIMIAGLAFQVFTMSAFGYLGLAFLWRVADDHHVRVRDRVTLNPNIVALRTSLSFKAFIWCILGSTLLIFARCCYRVAELSGGWKGDLMKNQGLFVVCEGAFILMASVLLIGGHPAITATRVMDAGGKFGSVRQSLSNLCCFIDRPREDTARAPRDEEIGLSTLAKYVGKQVASGHHNQDQVPPPPQPQTDTGPPIEDQSSKAFSRRKSQPGDLTSPSPKPQSEYGFPPPTGSANIKAYPS